MVTHEPKEFDEFHLANEAVLVLPATHARAPGDCASGNRSIQTTAWLHPFAPAQQGLPARLQKQ
jgi:hypothetical protein